MEILGANSYSGNVRFQIAKGQVDQLFLKWISQSTTDQLIKRLLTEIESGTPGQTLTAPPSPLFITKVQKQPNSPSQKGLTPPRSPSGEKYSSLGRTMSPKQSLSLLKEFGVNPAQNNYTNEALAVSDPYAAAFAKTDASAMSSMIKGGSLDFGDLKSGSGSGFAGGSPGFQSESEKARQTSPRSPVGRRDKKPQDFVTKQTKPKSPTAKEEKAKIEK